MANPTPTSRSVLAILADSLIDNGDGTLTLDFTGTAPGTRLEGFPPKDFKSMLRKLVAVDSPAKLQVKVAGEDVLLDSGKNLQNSIDDGDIGGDGGTPGNVWIVEAIVFNLLSDSNDGAEVEMVAPIDVTKDYLIGAVDVDPGGALATTTVKGVLLVTAAFEAAAFANGPTVQLSDSVQGIFTMELGAGGYMYLEAGSLSSGAGGVQMDRAVSADSSFMQVHLGGGTLTNGQITKQFGDNGSSGKVFVVVSRQR